MSLPCSCAPTRCRAPIIAPPATAATSFTVDAGLSAIPPAPLAACPPLVQVALAAACTCASSPASSFWPPADPWVGLVAGQEEMSAPARGESVRSSTFPTAAAAALAAAAGASEVASAAAAADGPDGVAAALAEPARDITMCRAATLAATKEYLHACTRAYVSHHQVQPRPTCRASQCYAATPILSRSLHPIVR